MRVQTRHFQLMFRPLTRLLVGSILIVSTACSPEVTQEEHRRALEETRQAWGRAIAEGDVERIFSFWTEDVVIYPVSESAVRGKDAVRDYVRRNRQERGLIPRVTPLEIVASESGDLGYVVGRHEWIDRNGEATLPGRYVSMWRKNEKGEWRCFLEIHSPRPSDAVEKTEIQE